MSSNEISDKDLEQQKEMCELKAKQLEVALEAVDDVGGEDAGTLPDHMKKKISNCRVQLAEIISFYRDTAELDNSEIREELDI